jgi:hypothetical protein
VGAKDPILVPLYFPVLLNQTFKKKEVFVKVTEISSLDYRKFPFLPHFTNPSV